MGTAASLRALQNFGHRHPMLFGLVLTDANADSILRRLAGLLIPLLALLYAAATMLGIAVPRWTMAARWPAQLLVDVALLGFAALHFHLFVRPCAREETTSRSARVMSGPTAMGLTGILLAVLFAGWQPLPVVIWSAAGRMLPAVLWAGWALGWALALGGDCLRRPGACQRAASTAALIGLALAEWCTPTMTLGHLVFALGFSLFLLTYADDIRRLAGRDA